ncbi:MAG: transcriptional repressor [Nitrospirae bacterium]|nr:transcriptional repressor [Nitrospirota bacterium]
MVLQYVENIKQYFEDFLRKRQLKMTAQRDLILEEFLGSRKHLSIEELHNLLIQKDNTIGHTTVYRMLKLLTEAGLAREDDFGDGVKRYEYESSHHDHLICVSCKKTVEIFDSRIESMQEELAQSNGFIITAHRLDIFGICNDCRNNARDEAIAESGITADRKLLIIDADGTALRKTLSLALLKTGGKGKITGFASHKNFLGNAANQRKERRIQEMGVRIGKTVEILNNGGKGPILLKIDDLRIALGRALAMEIMVKVED